MKYLMPQQQFIARSTFQWILHQALVADERYVYCGVVGTAASEPQTIQHVAMIKDMEDVEQTLSVWQDLDIVCAGYFHFEQDTACSAVVDAMPKQFLELAVNLDEKGRLDLFVYPHGFKQSVAEKVVLKLTEDGQSATDA